MFRYIVLLNALLLAAPSYATSVVALDPVEQASESTAIVDAVVGAAVPVERYGQVFTETTLHVRSVLCGSAPATIPVTQLKGVRADGARFFVIGDAELQAGERVVAFVRRDPDGNWYLTALSQSVWHVSEDGSVERSTDGLELFERTVRGVVPAIETPPTFDRVGDLTRSFSTLTCEGSR